MLGVAVRRLVLAQGVRLRLMEAEDVRLIEGYHAFETDIGIRWTDGDAAVPADLFADMTAEGMLQVYLGAATRYADLGNLGQAA